MLASSQRRSGDTRHPAAVASHAAHTTRLGCTAFAIAATHAGRGGGASSDAAFTFHLSVARKTRWYLLCAGLPLAVRTVSRALGLTRVPRHGRDPQPSAATRTSVCTLQRMCRWADLIHCAGASSHGPSAHCKYIRLLCRVVTYHINRVCLVDGLQLLDQFRPLCQLQRQRFAQQLALVL